MGRDFEPRGATEAGRRLASLSIATEDFSNWSDQLFGPKLLGESVQEG